MSGSVKRLALRAGVFVGILMVAAGIIAGCSFLGPSSVAPKSVSAVSITSPSGTLTVFPGDSVVIQYTITFTKSNQDIVCAVSIGDLVSDEVIYPQPFNSPVVPDTWLQGSGANGTGVIHRSMTLQIPVTADGGTYDVVVTARQPDSNGVDYTATQIDGIEVEGEADDTTPPVLTGQGGETTIECPASPSFTAPTATDPDDPAEDIAISFVDSITDSTGCSGIYTITRTWTASDPAGNRSVPVTQTIHVVDTTKPSVTITAPAAICYPSIRLPEVGYSVSDNCTETSAIDVEVSGYSTEEGTHTVTVTATDCSGNSTSASVTYTVDDTPPVVVISSPKGDILLGSLVHYAFTVTELNGYDVATSPAGIDDGDLVETSIDAIGAHDFCVTVTDCAGNVGSACSTYNVYALGCSHGYWKNHTSAWGSLGFSTSMHVNTLFTAFPSGGTWTTWANQTLLSALKYTGTSTVKPLDAARLLVVQAIAAVLNQAKYGSSYPFEDVVVAAVNQALMKGTDTDAAWRARMLALKTQLDWANNMRCVP